MTSSQIRKSFLDFFKSKAHTIVPSSSLMPDSPNLLFSNAGMNQFVPIFLGQAKSPYRPPRAADTQKCIRAGGKQNDLDDVGFDTYHHTFFEMLGNWSFGDYFKKEAIDWAWELVVRTWGFPPNRLYATVFCPYHGKPAWQEKWRRELEQVLVLTMTSSAYIPADPNASPFDVADQEAAMYWAKKFQSAGCDPRVHIVPGNKKDNFWMMGDTGPCGPCSELHVDLTAAGDTRGSLVNAGDARCIEIWNLVFIQFNANADGSFVLLPEKHVDTGMGLERVTSILQGTSGLTDFANARISNYEIDTFRPIFDTIEKLSGKKYSSTLPSDITPEERADFAKKAKTSEFDTSFLRMEDKSKQVEADVAFRVIADHIRTLSFAIADGIQPSNTDRGYVLRRILRRAVRYGRVLGLQESFFYKLVDVLADTMGDVFPEIRAKKKQVQEVIQAEEKAFNETLDRGIELFNEVTEQLFAGPQTQSEHGLVFPADQAFKLYDTYGFPLDLTEVMARERGMTVDKAGFEKLMEEQRNRARAAQKKEVISVSKIATTTPTKFVGYDNLETQAKVLETVLLKDKPAVVLDVSACYAEMGGQVGDTGVLSKDKERWRIANTQKSGNTWLHMLESSDENSVLEAGSTVTLNVDANRRNAIQRHHTVTHLLHWALHEVVSKEATQKGSFVGPDKLTFDFNSAALTPAQIEDVEKLVNERILENAGVSWMDVPYPSVKNNKNVMQFFGDKYGETVRVVQIGGHTGMLDGYSMELCGGTHTRATGEIGLFRIVGESAIAAGVRRIEAIAGLTAYDGMKLDRELIKSVAGKVSSPIHELDKKIESLLAYQKSLEKEVKLALQRNASNAASELLGTAQIVHNIPLITHNLGDADGEFLQAIADALKGRFKGVVVLGGGSNSTVALVASVSPEFTAKVQAGKIIQTIAPIVGGKGGGRPDNARGGGKEVAKLDEALAKAKSLLG